MSYSHVKKLTLLFSDTFAISQPFLWQKTEETKTKHRTEGLKHCNRKVNPCVSRV